MILDTNTCMLTDGSHGILLSKTEIKLMVVLALSGVEMTVPHKMLLSAFGAGVDPVANLKVYVSRVRKRLAGAGMAGLIVTTWGRGFRLRELVEVRGSPCPAIIQADRVAALRALLWSHPDHAASERFLVELGE